MHKVLDVDFTIINWLNIVLIPLPQPREWNYRNRRRAATTWLETRTSAAANRFGRMSDGRRVATWPIDAKVVFVSVHWVIPGLINTFKVEIWCQTKARISWIIKVKLRANDIIPSSSLSPPHYRRGTVNWTAWAALARGTQVLTLHSLKWKSVNNVSASLNKLTQFPVLHVSLSLHFQISDVDEKNNSFTMKHITHLFPCVFLLPPLESFLLNADVDRSFVVSSGTGKLVAYPCSCSGIRKRKSGSYHGIL